MNCVRVLVPLIGTAIVATSALGAPPPPSTALDSSRGAYLIFNSLAEQECLVTTPDCQAPTGSRTSAVLDDPAKRDLLQGVSFKVAWKWLEKGRNTINWQYLVPQLTKITDYTRANGEHLKVHLAIDVARHAPSWLFMPDPQTGAKATKFYYKDRVSTGSAEAYQDAELAVPWDDYYTACVDSFVTRLRDRLRAKLDADRYALITQIGVSAPGGARDQFLPPLGKDDQALTGARESRAEPVQCTSNNQPFFHDYDAEWVSPDEMACFTGGNPYVDDPSLSGNKLAQAHVSIADHLVDVFDDKVIVRTVFMPESIANATSGTSKSVGDILSLVVDASPFDSGRYALQINALSGGATNRWDYDNLLDANRVKKGALVTFEMLRGVAATPGTTLMQAVVNGLNRDAKAIRIYVGDLYGTGAGVDANMEALGFLNNYYNAPDTSAPPKIQSLAPGAPAEPHSATLTWNAPGEDVVAGQLCGVGVVREYIIRTSPQPITAGNFGSARLVPNDIIPARVDGSEFLTVTGLSSGPAYFAIKSKDDAGNISVISNVLLIAVP